MADWETYYQPERIDQALAALDKAAGRGRVIAGGTDLLLDIQQGRQPPVEVLVDVARIEEMRRIEIDGDLARIGAAVPHATIVGHPVLQERAEALTEACGLIGGPQVRVVATLGGNVAHALPAGDGTIALLALDARAELASSSGRQLIPMAQLFAGPGETTFDRSREILTGFRVPLTTGAEASGFLRVMRPQGVAIAILNMAAWVRLSTGGVIEAIRIACGPAGPVPFRCTQTETAALGQAAGSLEWDRIISAFAEETRFRTSSHRATADYRRHLGRILLERLLNKVLDRCVGRQVA
jgi:CO/xanthine dehydrogenase FAD-binding subunit